MTQAKWLIIAFVRDIFPIHILTKFGDDWIKPSKVIHQTRLIRGNFHLLNVNYSQVTEAMRLVIKLV